MQTLKALSLSGRLGVAVLFLVTLSASAQTTPGEFTIAALPDTQIYAHLYPQIFTSQTQWIADHAAEQNIQLVVGLGDIVDGGGSLVQWQNADLAYRTIDDKIPYVAAIGNHDYDKANPGGRTESTKNFNAYFGPQRYAGKSWYKGQYPAGSNENFYAIVTLAGKQYLILVLECFPRNAALSWASAVIANHPGLDTIVVTHAYTYSDNTRMDRCYSNSAASDGAGTDNDGQQIWEKFASKYSQITMVLSGHVVQGDGTGHRTDLGVNGNIVNQMLSDYQAWTNGGNGYLRLITVRPATNEVIVRTYSPFLDVWMTDSHNQFTVPYKNIGLAPGTGTITGRVRSSGACKGIQGAIVSNGESSVATDLYGNFSLPASGPKGYKLNVTQPGSVSLTQSVSLLPGIAAPHVILSSPAGAITGIAMWQSVALPNAKVVLTGGALRINISTTTAADGTFSFKTIANGSYTVTVTVPGTTNSMTSATSVVGGVTSKLTMVVN
jgi:hypothetical protein